MGRKPRRQVTFMVERQVCRSVLRINRVLIARVGKELGEMQEVVADG